MFLNLSLSFFLCIVVGCYLDGCWLSSGIEANVQMAFLLTRVVALMAKSAALRWNYVSLILLQQSSTYPTKSILQLARLGLLVVEQ